MNPRQYFELDLSHLLEMEHLNSPVRDAVFLITERLLHFSFTANPRGGALKQNFTPSATSSLPYFFFTQKNVINTDLCKSVVINPSVRLKGLTSMFSLVAWTFNSRNAQPARQKIKHSFHNFNIYMVYIFFFNFFFNQLMFHLQGLTWVPKYLEKHLVTQ